MQCFILNITKIDRFIRYIYISHVCYLLKIYIIVIFYKPFIENNNDDENINVNHLKYSKLL